jgi:N-methylhydantoinase A
VEIVTLRARASLPQPTHEVGSFKVPRRQKSTPSFASVSFGGRLLKTGVLEREALASGFSAVGPLIVTEYTATTVVPPGWRLSVSPSGALLIARKAKLAQQRKRRSK